MEMPHNRAGRGLAAEDVEEGRQCVLHLAVGIEDHAIVVVIDQSGGQAHLQLAAARLALDAALQARAEHVQLGFAHRSLQPQQQPVVEMARVVQAVLIKDQGSARRRSPAGDASRWNCGPGVEPPARARSPRAPCSPP